MSIFCLGQDTFLLFARLGFQGLLKNVLVYRTNIFQMFLGVSLDGFSLEMLMFYGVFFDGFEPELLMIHDGSLDGFSLELLVFHCVSSDGF